MTSIQYYSYRNRRDFAVFDKDCSDYPSHGITYPDVEMQRLEQIECIIWYSQGNHPGCFPPNGAGEVDDFLPFASNS